MAGSLLWRFLARREIRVWGLLLVLGVSSLPAQEVSWNVRPQKSKLIGVKVETWSSEARGH